MPIKTKPAPKTKPVPMTLCAPRHCFTDYNTRSLIDGRCRVDYHVYEYRGSDGENYRKSFETRPGQTPSVPQQATHAELNSIKTQQ